MQIKKIDINDNLLKQYKNQKNVKRRSKIEGGYDYVLVASDADLDGIHIGALLTGFIFKFKPEYKSKFGRLRTPVKMVLKNNKPKRWVYNIQDHLEANSGETFKYFKGLGTWSKDLLDEVIKKDKLDTMIDVFDFKNSSNIINDFLSSSESDKRKNYIKSHTFSIANL